jgi:plastocyanin
MLLRSYKTGCDRHPNIHARLSASAGSSDPVPHRTSMAKLLARQLRQLAQVLIVGSLVTGCGGDGGGNGGTPPPTTTIAKASTNSGDVQSGTVGQSLAAPLRVIVTEDGSPTSGATVAWSTSATGASINPTSAVTDASGIASAGWTLGTVSGSQTAQATLSGASGSPVSFTATASPGPATTLAKAGGDQQNGVINTPLAAALQAKASDQFGNGVAEVAVGWAVTSGGASLSAPSVPTSAAGISGVNVTLGGTAGPITITATSEGLIGSPLTFTATATTAPTTATVSVINNSFSPDASTIAVGATVTWNWPAGSLDHNVVPDDGSTPSTSGGPSNGPDSHSFTFTAPGTFRYHCAVHGAPGGVGMSGVVTVQ